MSAQTDHHGIIYTIRQIGDRRWQWTLDPPVDVTGWQAKSGIVAGARADAVAAAKRAIESQEAKNSN